MSGPLILNDLEMLFFIKCIYNVWNIIDVSIWNIIDVSIWNIIDV